jgi:MSHA biogenesis protein MshG
MRQYKYIGRNHEGMRVEGEIHAESVEAVASQLSRESITPIDIHVLTKEEKSFDFNAWFDKKVSYDDLSMFCRQMHALTKSGIPIVRAMNGLADTTRSEQLSEALHGLSKQLSRGVNLATAMRQYPNIFNQLFISMVHVGETTGRLDDAFQKLVGHVELERDTVNRVKSALRYPILVICFILLAIVVINLMVIPNFANVFAKLGSDLPLPTKILMATSNFFVQYWWAMLVFTIVSVIGFIQWKSTDEGAYLWDKFKLKIPVVGDLLYRIALSRFTRTFAMMVQAGVPIVQAIGISASAVGNLYVEKAIQGMRLGIERGESIAQTANATKMFTPLILQMISVGEESGTVDRLLYDISDFYEQEIDYDIKRLSDAVEPIMLVFMGVMVLVLALGIFLPMWELTGAVK